LVGAPTVEAAELMAGALAALGLARGFVVHGSDGLDEITITGSTLVLEIAEGRVVRRTVTPADFGVEIAPLSELRGGDADENCEIARAVLAGARGPKRDVVLVNAAAALVAAGQAATFLEAMALAAESIDSGAAQSKLEALAAFPTVPPHGA
jgi:anthranilate phosphoribosyltransferase